MSGFTVVIMTLVMLSAACFVFCVQCRAEAYCFKRKRKKRRFGGPYYIGGIGDEAIKNDEKEGKTMVRDEDFVRVKDFIKDIEVELKYATEDNFTEHVIYNFSEAYLRYATVLKLAKVQEELKEKGFRLKIWDAFRPVQAQFRLWEVYPDSTFVANPNEGYSSHSKGNTVDITLVTAGGEYVEMPTPFDDFSEKAKRSYVGVSEEGRKNSLMLEKIMQENGFVPYVNEWWHFSDEQDYPVEKEFEPK